MSILLLVVVVRLLVMAWLYSCSLVSGGGVYVTVVYSCGLFMVVVIMWILLLMTI